MQAFLEVSQKPVQSSYSVENSSADITSGIFCNFKNTQGLRLRLKVYYLQKGNSITKLLLEILPNFQNVFKLFGQETFLVTLQPAECKSTALIKRKFPEIFRRATFRKIPMPMIDFSTKLQNTEIFSVALLKVDSITNALLVILKFVGTLTGNLGFSFQYSYRWLHT